MPPGYPTGPRCIGAFAYVGSLVVKQVLHGPARRVMLAVRVRHEVVRVAVVIVVSSVLTAIRRDTTRFSATGILPGRASLVTAGCEAPGTSVSLIPISST